MLSSLILNLLGNTFISEPCENAIPSVKRSNLCFFTSQTSHHLETRGEAFNKASARTLSGMSDSLKREEDQEFVGMTYKNSNMKQPFKFYVSFCQIKKRRY